MNRKIRIAIIPILFYVVLLPLEADILVDRANTTHIVSTKKVDKKYVYCTGAELSGLLRIPIESIYSLTLDDGTILVDNSKLKRVFNLGFDPESFNYPSSDSEISYFGSVERKINTPTDYTSFGYGCLIVSGVIGLVNNNREYNGESLDDLEKFADQAKLLQNIHYGFMIIGAGVLLYSNTVIKNDSTANSNR